MIELCQAVNCSEPMFRGNFNAALTQFDTNSDGVIDFNEFLAGLATIIGGNLVRAWAFSIRFEFSNRPLPRITKIKLLWCMMHLFTSTSYKEKWKSNGI